jgi:hypothetical protein
MRTVMSWPAITPIISRAGAGVAKIEVVAGPSRPPTPRPSTSTPARPWRWGPKRAQGIERVQDVLALKQAGDTGAAGGEGAKQKRPVRD